MTFEVHEVQRRGRSIGLISRPTSVLAALTLLRDDATARPLAGGTDLLLDLQRSGNSEAPPISLVDLTAIEGFGQITEAGDRFVLAGGVTHNQVVLSTGIRQHALALSQACLEIGSPQLRNRATLAGNLATASPANDSISALMALGASVDLQRLDEAGDLVTRTVAVREFFTGFRQTVIEPPELIVAIHVPKIAAHDQMSAHDQKAQGQSIWVKLGLRKAQAISVVHGAIALERNGSGIVTDARLALGSVAATVVMVPAFRDQVVGRELTDDIIERAADAAAEAVEPISDGRATAEYRSATISVLVSRSLKSLRAGTEASMWLDEPPTLSSQSELETPAPAAPGTLIPDTGASVALAPAGALSVTVNGRTVSAPGADLTLLDWLRERAGAHPDHPLSGVKEGCAEGECGACTVTLNGPAVMSCLVLAGQADGGTVVTIEGLGTNPELHPLQHAFVDEFAVQCGFCIPGFLMAASRLLEENPRPSDDQIKLALSGNLCRCTGYYPIIAAVKEASEAQA